ncbi:hypothetical protein A6B43_06020 [Vespertiliibacter pulmonis]|uniref:Chalcone isomerase-like protein n=1 Tax=Vespertiliibacter pulmonis TaxID=1443036 RepID=A0A3N4VL21_9PAST|nr:pyruvate formate lyase-activating protein [Vespertiliibacter pulmonis]QLB21656.1 hypothetical protein A6B43_06020 [Vespertiliibacter pulmonis]RPE83792.1 hypothetical protein EDC46_0995 [Vespertiliibacter pulmonis]
MRYFNLFFISIVLFPLAVSANWKKINDIDYVWGPFTIYNLSLFSETGEYQKETRPVMLTLKYMKPVDGRDFAISLARSWSKLGITLPNQDEVVDRLRKIMPNIKKGDLLSYIALEDKGYFILNDTVIDEEFNRDFNNAVVAVWLDPRVEIGKALLAKQQKIEMLKPSIAVPDSDRNADNILLKTDQIEQSIEKISDETKNNFDKSTVSDSNQNNDIKPEMNRETGNKDEKKAIGKDDKEENSEEDSLEVFPPNDPVLLKEQPVS